MEEIIYVQLVRNLFRDNESRWLKKNIKTRQLEKIFSSLIDYMTNPDFDELNENDYTPEQQIEAKELQRLLKDNVGAVTFHAQTKNEPKMIHLNDILKDHAEDIVLEKEMTDDAGSVKLKQINVMYSWDPGPGIYYK